MSIMSKLKLKKVQTKLDKRAAQAFRTGRDKIRGDSWLASQYLALKVKNPADMRDWLAEAGSAMHNDNILHYLMTLDADQILTAHKVADENRDKLAAHLLGTYRIEGLPKFKPFHSYLTEAAMHTQRQMADMRRMDALVGHYDPDFNLH